MVLYFKARPEVGDYTIYMGLDKHENEELIKYGFPEDIWFHVDKMSSAHVYLRLNKNQTIDDICEGLLEDCAQLVKANSIQGNKVNNVDVVYTPWYNLKKTPSMDVGQVGFHNSKMVRTVRVEKRVNEIVNRLNKTKVERNPDLKDGRVGSSSATTPDGMGEASSSTSLIDGSDCDFLRQQQALHGRITGPKRRSTKGQWTPEEDEILCNAVHHYHGKNWKKIAECFPDRTDVQCLHRWQKVLNPALVKGPWSKEEDEIIIEMVNKFGPKKWSTISQALPGRIGKQCRERWHNHLNPAINKDAWTQEEEIALIHAHQIYGNKWAELTKFLPGRSDNSIKNHWNSSVKKKLESYMVQGLIERYPGLPNVVSSTTARIRQKNHDSGFKEKSDIEDSSECSSSALVASSQSECEMAKPITEDGDHKQEEAIKKEVDSHLPVRSSEYYGSAEEATFGASKFHCAEVLSEVASPGNFLPKAEGSGNEIRKPSNDDNYEKKDTMPHKPTSLETSTSDAGLGFENNDKPWISLNNGCSPNLFQMHPVTALGMENLDCAAAMSCKSFIHSPGASMNFAPYSYPVFPVNTSNMYGLPFCQSLMNVPPSFICPSANVDIQDLSWRLQNSGSIAGSFIGVPISDCPMPPVPEVMPSSHETIDQGNERQVQLEEKQRLEEETQTYTSSCDNLTRNLSLASEEKVEFEKDLEPGTVSPPDEMKDNQSENFFNSGSLFYEPPRIQSLEFPFVCCDIVSSDLQQAYSPLGIRQLMMSSASCNLWDSPSRDDSPDGILKHAAKSFICTPSIMKKRQRELLSPLQERRFDKKSGTDMNRGSFFTSLTKGDEACMEYMIGEVDAENICSSLADDVRDSLSDLKDKRETIKQNKNLGAKLTQKSTASKSSSASKFQPNSEDCRSGAKLSSVVDSDAKEPQCNAVLVERNTTNLECLSGCSTFISPTACGTKHVDCSITVTSLQYPPSSKKPQIAVEKFTPSIDADYEIFNIFADTPGIKRGLESPSSWKSPLFLNSFLTGADFTYEDMRYFMSPGERTYDALGLMKQLSEQNAGVIAEAQEVLSNGGQKLNFDNVLSNNSPQGNGDSSKEQENLIPIPSNVLWMHYTS
ncbi:transcription factor MYB3R-4 isoform X2 [Dendrobium catenatum]|uniref:transcription factor MYB3R-4 isoform X2 n=1 Tax=Dendrobium catenatum TaxID=906689 RepID=UPI0010A07516|nr:transcription factor MYB3R-4 isoform X2 [Dendrobium catenatum]